MLDNFKHPPTEYQVIPVRLRADERFAGANGAGGIQRGGRASRSAKTVDRQTHGSVTSRQGNDRVDQVFAQFLDIAEQAACEAHLSTGAYSTVFWKLVSSSVHTAGLVRVQSELPFRLR